MPKKPRQKAPNTTARNAAMNGRPHRLPAVREEEKDGKLYVTALCERPKWQRFLGAGQTCERTFGLDAYGQRVYRSCDGKRTVRQIVERFAGQTHVSVPEAEMAVAQFLRTLLSKGLVVMEMEKLS